MIHNMHPQYLLVFKEVLQLLGLAPIDELSQTTIKLVHLSLRSSKVDTVMLDFVYIGKWLTLILFSFWTKLHHAWIALVLINCAWKHALSPSFSFFYCSGFHPVGPGGYVGGKVSPQNTPPPTQPKRSSSGGGWLSFPPKHSPTNQKDSIERDSLSFWLGGCFVGKLRHLP